VVKGNAKAVTLTDLDFDFEALEWDFPDLGSWDLDLEEPEAWDDLET
jgi:hypothetical protein